METEKHRGHEERELGERKPGNEHKNIKSVDWKKLNPSTEYIDSQSGIGIGRQENYMVYQPEPTKKELRAQIRSLEKNLEEANKTIEKLKKIQDESQIHLRRKMDQTLDEERYYNMVQLDNVKFELRQIREMIDSFARYSYAVVEAKDMLDKRPCLFNIKRKMDKIFEMLYKLEGKSPSEWIPPSIQYHIPERYPNNMNGLSNKRGLFNPEENVYPKSKDDYVILGNKVPQEKKEVPDIKLTQQHKTDKKKIDPNDNGLDKNIDIKKPK